MNSDWLLFVMLVVSGSVWLGVAVRQRSEFNWALVVPCALSAASSLLAACVMVWSAEPAGSDIGVTRNDALLGLFGWLIALSILIGGYFLFRRRQ